MIGIDVLCREKRDADQAPKHVGSACPLKRRHRRFCSSCLSSSRQVRRPASVRTWKPDGSSTTPCSRQGSAACARCEPIPPGRSPEPSPRHTQRNAKRPFRPCGSATASPSTPSAARRSAGWPWLAERLDAVLARTLATRAYRALNRVCVGKARRVRFKSRGRGLGSIENKRNDTGLRFVLETAEEGHRGSLIWHKDRLPALIDWDDPVVAHGLAHQIKYARLVRRSACSPRAQGADREGNPYSCNWCSMARPTTSPNTWWARTPSAWTWDRRASPLCRGKRKPGSSRCVLSFVPMRELFVACSAAWSGRGARQSGALRRAGSAQETRQRCSPLEASRAVATRSAGGARRPASAGWRPTARACMADWLTRSRRWATPSSPRSFPTKAGRNATARAWDFVLQGC